MVICFEAHIGREWEKMCWKWEMKPGAQMARGALFLGLWGMIRVSQTRMGEAARWQGDVK